MCKIVGTTNEEHASYITAWFNTSLAYANSTYLCALKLRRNCRRTCFTLYDGRSQPFQGRHCRYILPSETYCIHACKLCMHIHASSSKAGTAGVVDTRYIPCMYVWYTYKHVNTYVYISHIFVGNNYKQSWRKAERDTSSMNANICVHLFSLSLSHTYTQNKHFLLIWASSWQMVIQVCSYTQTDHTDIPCSCCLSINVATSFSKDANLANLATSKAVALFTIKDIKSVKTKTRVCKSQVVAWHELLIADTKATGCVLHARGARAHAHTHVFRETSSILNGGWRFSVYDIKAGN